jgi:broad specificity phosphatase PhoE
MFIKFSKIKTFRQLNNKLNQTTNPYDRLKITKTWLEVEKLHLDINPNTDQVANNYNKFLKNLKKSNDKNILVISHSESINILQKIICNIDIMNMDLDIQNKDIKSNYGNCCILCLSLEKNKYSIVSPANTSHLN